LGPSKFVEFLGHVKILRIFTAPNTKCLSAAKTMFLQALEIFDFGAQIEAGEKCCAFFYASKNRRFSNDLQASIFEDFE